LRAALGYEYSPDLSDQALIASEFRKAVHLGSHAEGGLYDDASTLLGALYLLHDFQNTRPASVEPLTAKLVGFLQAGLSNRMRRELRPRLEESLKDHRRNLSQVSSNLFAQILSESRHLLVQDTIDQQAAANRLADLATILNDPVFDETDLGPLQDEITRLQNAPIDNRLALVTRLDQLSQEIVSLRIDLLRRIDGIVVVMAQL
ncbi:hypothetical protein, partial [Pseudophaeobacter sp.]|uniref:hypothetical protein n=1 Tax=Pseudophaeobacter sp. TaxID=1971739 RepID=UPI003296D1B3